MSDIIPSDDSLSASPRDHDDLTPTQEYLIAGLVILLFGLLYWFLNHGWNADADRETIHLSAPRTDVIADVPGKATLPAAAVTTATVASPPTSPNVVESATDPIEEKGVIKESTHVNFQVKAPSGKTEIEEPLSEADVAHLKSAEVAIKQAQAEIAKTKEPIKKPGVVKATSEQVTSEQITEASADTSSNGDKKDESASESLVYVLPDGTEINIAPDGFENQLKTAILNGEVNKPYIFDNIYFESGSSQIDAKSDHQIRATAALLHNHPDVRILLRGHTDNTGLPSSNVQLSLMRANAMGLALGGLGIDTQRIRVLGVGDAEPIDTNETEEGRSKNRRIEVSIIK